MEAAQASDAHAVYPVTARVIVGLLRICAVYQFHDTSDTSAFERKWDLESNSDELRSHGGNLAAILYRMEQEDTKRYEWICQQISRVLPTFERFTISERYGQVFLGWTGRRVARRRRSERT